MFNMKRNSTTLYLQSPGATTPISWVNNAPDFSAFTEPTLSVLQKAWQDFLDSGEELEVIPDPEPVPEPVVPNWDASLNFSVNTVTYNDGGTSTIDANSGGNVVFSLTSNGSSTTIAMANIPTTGTRYAFELHLTWTSGAIIFPASWSKGDTRPNATGSYVITGITIDGGANYKLAVLVE